MTEVTFTVGLNEVTDPFEDEYTYLEWDKGTVVVSGISADKWSALAEGWAQSDTFWVDICNAIVNGEVHND